MLQFFLDWIRVNTESMPILTRNTSKGAFFWGTTKNSRDALAQVREQLLKQKYDCQWARFGGIYVVNNEVARGVYEALMHQCGYPIAVYGKIGNATVKFIDTP